MAQPWWNPSVFHPILPLECRSEAKKTKVKKKTNNPQFDEVFYFEVGVSVAQTQSTPTPQGPWPKGPWPLLRRVPGCCPTPGVPPTRQREPPGAPSFPGQKGCLLLPAGPGFVLDAVRSALPERPRLWALAGWVWVFCSTQSPLSSRGRLVSPQIVRVSGVEAAHSNESPQLPLRTRTTSWLVGEGQAGTELPTTAPRCQPRSRSRGHCPPQRPPQVSVRVSLPPPWFTAQRGEGGAAVPVWRPCHRGSQSRVGAPPPGGSGRGFWSGAGRHVRGVPGWEAVRGLCKRTRRGGSGCAGGHWPLPPGPSKGWATVASSGGCGGLEAQPESLGEEPVPPWDVLVVARRKRWPALPHGVHLQGCAGVSQRPGPAEA